jgi:hypothetical protein
MARNSVRPRIRRTPGRIRLPFRRRFVCRSHRRRRNSGEVSPEALCPGSRRSSRDRGKHHRRACRRIRRACFRSSRPSPRRSWACIRIGSARRARRTSAARSTNRTGAPRRIRPIELRIALPLGHRSSACTRSDAASRWPRRCSAPGTSRSRARCGIHRRRCRIRRQGRHRYSVDKLRGRIDSARFLRKLDPPDTFRTRCAHRSRRAPSRIPRRCPGTSKGCIRKRWAFPRRHNSRGLGKSRSRCHRHNGPRGGRNRRPSPCSCRGTWGGRPRRRRRSCRWSDRCPGLSATRSLWRRRS